MCTLAQKSVDRSEERQSLLRDITPDQGRTREDKEPSSHGHISPASVGRVSGYVKAYPVSPASLRDRTGGYGPPDRRSNRLLETYTAEGRHSV